VRGRFVQARGVFLTSVRLAQVSGFDSAKSLAGAKNLSEILELQAAYWQKQLNTLPSQAEELHSRPRWRPPRASRSKEQVKRRVDELRAKQTEWLAPEARHGPVKTSPI
jgi:hypothetical protein